MKAILRITEGSAPEPTLFVEAGQNVVVGRVPPADFTVPDDPLMSSRHFCVRCDAEGCALEDLGSTNGTTINDEPATVKPLHDGDRIRCGNTAFQVTLESTPAESPPVESASTAVGAPPRPTAVNSPAPIQQAGEATIIIAEELGPERGFVAETAAAICERFELGKELTLAPEEKETPEAFAERLTSVDEESLSEAITFMAYALPKRLGVWWATRCLRQVNAEGLSEEDEKAVQAAENWVVEPSDENRRAGFELAQQADFQTAASFAAASPFWCHGSLAPPESEATIPPGDNIAGKSIGGCIVMASVAREPEHAAGKQRGFLDLAMQVATGENTWEDK